MSFTNLRNRIGPLLGAFAAAISLSFATAGPKIDEARSAVSEWVGVEKLITEERSSWFVEKEIISDMIALLKREKASLDERIETASGSISDADSKRSGLMEERDEYIGAMDYLGESIGALEARIVALYQRFPPPLQKEVSVTYARLPQEGAQTRLTVSQRLQTLIVLLSQADKFNGGVQVVSELQSVGGGQAEVDILYFGLGGAFFQDKNGTYAGIGYPGSDGWEWKEAPESADRIADLFAVYAGAKEAEFVNLPVNIK